MSVERKKKMSKSQRFSKLAYEKNKRKKQKNIKQTKPNKNIRTEVEKIMNEGRKYGISYKKTNKNVKDHTHKNNISTVNSLLKDLGVNNLREIKEEKVMRYFEEQKRKYEDGDIKKGGYITNKINGLKRFYDSVKVSKGLNGRQKENILKNMRFIEGLDDWKKSNKIVKSKYSSSYLKPNSKSQKLINDRFHYLRNSRPNDKNIKIASDYHRFASVTGSRINHGVNSTLKNLEKLDDGRYLYIVRPGEDKTGKPRVKIIDNKNDIKFLDRFVGQARSRSDRAGHAYLFEMKVRGDNLSRNKIIENIQEVYRENFENYKNKKRVKVRYQKELYEVEERFVPHSSRSISIQKELKTRSLRYKRDPKQFDKDLKEMISFDVSKGNFEKDPRGSVIYGYERMKKKLKRELTIKEKAMYLTSVSHGHNRIDVMRDHYFSDDMNKWFKERGIK